MVLPPVARKVKQKPSSSASSAVSKRIALQTYSRIAQPIRLAKHFRKFPNFAMLLVFVRIDVRSYEVFLQSLERGSEELEQLSDFKKVCNLSSQPPPDLSYWVSHSVINELFKISDYALKPKRETSIEQVLELFNLISELPYHARNQAVSVVLKAKLSSMHFLKTYPRFLRNKQSTRDEYAGKVLRMADWFDLTVQNFQLALFSQQPLISDLEIMENIFEMCQNDSWIGATAAQYITALKGLSADFGSVRFRSDEWKQTQKDLKKTFGTRRSDQRLRKAVSKSAVKACFKILRRRGQFRKAETIRFMALTAQRNNDYVKLLPSDIEINHEKRFITIHWRWSKTSQVYLQPQKTMHPFGIPNSFFDLFTCVQNLLTLKPDRGKYLLRFTNLSHNALLRQAFALLPEPLQPDCAQKLTPYFFKNLMSRCCLESGVAAEVVSHYLKHTLSDAEWKTMCSNSRVNLSKVSTNYAIAQDLIPHIEKCFAPWWGE